MRGRRRKGVEYFGPYAHAYAIRQTLDLLLRTFPVRTCTDSKFRTHQGIGRPCLLFHIERCSGPCVGEVTPERYQGYVDGLAAFLDGDRDDAVSRLRTEMEDAASRQDYEVAARFRDQATAVEKALARQELVSDRPETFDLVAVEEDDLEAVLVVLRVTKGRVTGHRTTVLDKVEDLTSGELIGVLLGRLYDSDVPPSKVLVSEQPDDLELWEEVLGRFRGSTVRIRRPQRGAKRRLMETATANAREEFARHRLRRSADHNARARALRSLQDTARHRPASAPDRVLRHLDHPGQGHRWLHGRLRGRAPQGLRLPQVQGADRGRAGRLRRHGGGAAATLHRAARLAPPTRR